MSIRMVRESVVVRSGLLSAVLAGMVPGVALAAWFTDNGDRAPLQELRDRPPADLTPLERAILTAADRIGWIELPGCGRGSNAVLVSVGGRDAVVTSRHLIGAGSLETVHCDVDEPAVFYPNHSYVLPDGQSMLDPDVLWQEIAVLPGPVMAVTGLLMEPEEDWLVYFLPRTISDQPLPPGTFGAGRPRGAMAFSRSRPLKGDVVVIGIDGRFSAENGEQHSWQPCRFRRFPPVHEWAFYIDCDVSPGASSSLLGTFEDGELTFQGLVTAQLDHLTGTDVPLPVSPLLWNLGTSSQAVQAGLGQAD